MILDATAGNREMWFDKTPEDVLFVDKRVVPPGAIVQQPLWQVRPDIQADYSALPFADDSFDLVVFDPPHMRYRPSGTGIFQQKYTTVTDIDEVVAGLEECHRVTRRWLVFKWSDTECPLSDVLDRTTMRPLFGHRAGKIGATLWMMFDKSLGSAP